MPVSIPQGAMNAGELAPSMGARVDLDRYRSGLAKLLNMVVNAHGGVYNRAGFEFLGLTKNAIPPEIDGEPAAAFSPVRLVTFARAAEDPFVLEFGDLYIRFWRNGVPVMNDQDTAPYEIVSPYAAAELSRLQFAPSIDVVTITHPNHQPQELRHYGTTNWSIAGLFYLNPGAPDDVTLPIHQYDGVTREWEYAVSGVTPDGKESVAVLSPKQVTGASEGQPQPVRVTVGAQVVERYYIYKGLDGTYGFAGSMTTNPGDVPHTTQYTWKDHGVSPDYTKHPKSSDDKFLAAGTYKPGSCAIFAQRRWFGNVPTLPDTFWASAVGDYDEYALYVPSIASDPRSATLASSQLNEIRAMLPLDSLIFFTAGAVHVLVGVEDPDKMDAPARSHYGATWLRPLVAGNVVIFVDGAGHVREFVYQQEVNGYPAADLGRLASHLLKGRAIVDWVYIESPEPQIWAAMDDGQLLSLTYLREESVAGWAQHTTDGRVTSLAAVREGSYDVVYAVIERDGFGGGSPSLQCIERMPARQVDSVFWDGWMESAIAGIPDAMVLTGQAYTTGSVVTLAVDGNTRGGQLDGSYVFAAASVGARVELTLAGQLAAGIIVAVGLHDASLELVVDVPEAFQATVLTGWTLKQKVHPGFGLYANQEISVLADGEPHAAVTVDVTGAINLTRYAARVVAGRSYEGEINTLALSTQFDTHSSKRKSIASVGMLVKDTRGLLVGETGGLMYPAHRAGGLIGNALESGEIEPIKISASWNRGGRVTIKTTPGLPAEILALIPEVAIG